MAGNVRTALWANLPKDIRRFLDERKDLWGAVGAYMGRTARASDGHWYKNSSGICRNFNILQDVGDESVIGFHNFDHDLDLIKGAIQLETWQASRKTIRLANGDDVEALSGTLEETRVTQELKAYHVEPIPHDTYHVARALEPGTLFVCSFAQRNVDGLLPEGGDWDKNRWCSSQPLPIRYEDEKLWLPGWLRHQIEEAGLEVY